jgi:hypothetical protein
LPSAFYLIPFTEGRAALLVAKQRGAASIALAKQPSVFFPFGLRSKRSNEGLLPAKQQPFLKYLSDILRGCLLCFAGGMQATPSRKKQPHPFFFRILS